MYRLEISLIRYRTAGGIARAPARFAGPSRARYRDSGNAVYRVQVVRSNP
jgi:hypothetical protein